MLTKIFQIKRHLQGQRCKFISITYVTANSLSAQVTNKLCEFHVFSDFLLNSAADKRIPYALKSRRNRSKSSWPRGNRMQDRVGNITVLFSHCVKKKATLEGSINKEIRTSSRDKTVRVSNFVLPNSGI